MVDIALFQPDQAGNVGTILRTGACLEVPVHIIHPCGFSFSEKAFRRSAMDYPDSAKIHEYDNYHHFQVTTATQRIILLTTKTDNPFYQFTFDTNDILLLGQESCGVPDFVHQSVYDRVTIPMSATTRSINIAISGALVLSEVLRQTNSFPKQ